jgi:flavin-dependent dehydrogenase
VVVLERTLSPCHKVCGEFLSGETQCLLASLGLDARALGATPIAKLRLVKGERHAVSPLPFAAAGLSRYRLDQALLTLAQRAGAQVVRGVAVTGIEQAAALSVGAQDGDDAFNEGWFVRLRIAPDGIVLDKPSTTYTAEIGLDEVTTSYAVLKPCGGFDGAGIAAWIAEINGMRRWDIAERKASP